MDLMTTKQKKQIKDKSQQLFEFAQQKVNEVADWVELDNALFGVGGKANELFPTEAERSAFVKTQECKRI